MKKVIVVALILLSITVVMTSCGASRGTGCPGAQGIIH